MVKLSSKRSRWVTQRRKAKIVGSPLKANAGLSARYDKALGDLVGLMRRDYERNMRKLFESVGKLPETTSFASQSRILLNELTDKWEKRFGGMASEMSNTMMRQVDVTSKKQLEASLSELAGGITIKTPKMPKDLEDKVKAAIAENTRLIKSIPEQYHDKVAGTVMRSIEQGGEGAHEIFNMAMENIENTGFNVQKRASLIARTETSKISTMMQVERLKSAGITKVQWHHSGGGAQPRKLHQEYDGQIFDLDDPPIIDERTGERGWTGTLNNCKCFMTPVIEFEDGEEI